MLIVVVNAGYNLSYSIAEDKDAYYLPTFVVVVVLSAIGIYSLGEWAPPSLKAALLSLLCIAVPINALAANWPFDLGAAAE